MSAVNDAEALGVAIDAERIASRLSREELATLAEVSVESLGRYLRGETEPSLARLRQLASVLDQRPQDLLARADQIMGRAARRVTGASSVAGDVTADNQGVNVAGSTVFGDVNVVVPEGEDGGNPKGT